VDDGLVAVGGAFVSVAVGAFVGLVVGADAVGGLGDPEIGVVVD
jgi:hypothetical protein